MHPEMQEVIDCSNALDPVARCRQRSSVTERMHPISYIVLFNIQYTNMRIILLHITAAYLFRAHSRSLQLAK